MPEFPVVAADYATLMDRPTAWDMYRIWWGLLARYNLCWWWSGTPYITDDIPPPIYKVKTRPWSRYKTGYPSYEWKSSWKYYCDFVDDMAEVRFFKPDAFVDLGESAPENWTPTELHQAAFGMDDWPNYGIVSGLIRPVWTTIRDCMLQFGWTPMHGNGPYLEDYSPEELFETLVGESSPGDHYYRYWTPDEDEDFSSQVAAAISGMVNNSGYHTDWIGHYLRCSRYTDNKFSAGAYSQIRNSLASGGDYWWPSDAWEPYLSIDALFIQFQWRNHYYKEDDYRYQNDVWGTVDFEVYLNDKKIRTNPISLSVNDDGDWHGPLMVECDLYEDGDIITHRYQGYNTFEIRLIDSYNDFTGQNLQEPPDPYGTTGYSRTFRGATVKILPWVNISFTGQYSGPGQP